MLLGLLQHRLGKGVQVGQNAALAAGWLLLLLLLLQILLGGRSGLLAGAQHVQVLITVPNSIRGQLQAVVRTSVGVAAGASSGLRAGRWLLLKPCLLVLLPRFVRLACLLKAPFLPLRAVRLWLLLLAPPPPLLLLPGLAGAPLAEIICAGGFAAADRRPVHRAR